MTLQGISIGSLMGSSQVMDEVRTFVRRAASVNVPVLILGETGTGKSLLGKVIHRECIRSSGPYHAINCAGIPDALFESEFFGYQRGAFTGAREMRKGVMEQAQGGSLFLDEVGELSISQQAKLLTALEDGEIRRLGGEGTVRVDVRILAATSRDLPKEMKSGGFRRELFHRLAVLTCRIPPLRERPDDIPILSRMFLRKHKERHGRSASHLSAEAVRYLRAQPWPGNVRELSHLLEAALILSETDRLGVEGLHFARAMAGGLEATPGDDPGSRGDISSLKGRGESDPEWKGMGKRYAFLGTMEEERMVIEAALARAKGNRSQAARDLGMARNTLRKKLREYNLD